MRSKKRLVLPVNWKLQKVISGGQIGVDIAALRAAEAVGIPTGGFMPFGFLTLFGARPEYKERFGMVECPINGYRHRTHENVRHSDATLRIAYRFYSPGELCTMKAIREYSKPYLDIDPAKPIRPYRVAVWLRENGVETLNCAGNADWHLEPFAESYLQQVFRWLV